MGISLLHYFSHLHMFVDDTIIIAESLEVLPMTLEALYEKEPFGLKVSWAKNKVQVFGSLLFESQMFLKAPGYGRGRIRCTRVTEYFLYYTSPSSPFLNLSFNSSPSPNHPTFTSNFPLFAFLLLSFLIPY